MSGEPFSNVESSQGEGARPSVHGKFLYIGKSKFYVRGVTYGPFRPELDGSEYHDEETVERDFASMGANGINTVRTYTVPPRWLLDCAQRHDLRVMIGLPWEQHITFLHERSRVRDIERRVSDGVRSCTGHPAVLCYAIGNEVPSSIVRWHGHRRVENHIERLYHAAKSEDPGSLVTYVNYPSTEYLDLPFLDFLCFNVYLESPDRLDAYLARLHNLAGDRPLLLAEVGLDSRRNGEMPQAHALDWQVKTAFASGCAGVFVFSWTDEWHRGGHDIDDWDFGITRRDRRPKPSLDAVRSAFAQVPFPSVPWPKVSVVVCTYNGSRTIRDCLDGLQRVCYPNFEVIVVNDGSTDHTEAIVREFDVRLINLPNVGLSAARNKGLDEAAGEIIAYIDDDTRPDPHWLHYLTHSFLSGSYAAVGGPNIPPPGDEPIAHAVANSPGGPMHVLLSDRVAEHIPGCNMAFRKSALQAIGGFDPQFRVAGDDVDACWRLEKAGWTIGFHPTAMVWHRRRSSVRAYWKQQVGYGRAEALLEKKWPEKYDAAGQPAWSGRLYERRRPAFFRWRQNRIYHGRWGNALFQTACESEPSIFWSVARMPEWYLVIALLIGLSLLSSFWWPLRVALPLLVLAVGIPLIHATSSAAHASFKTASHSRMARLGLRILTAGLHLLQPLARLCGRQSAGLTPWRRSCAFGFALPWPRTLSTWSEHWKPQHEWLCAIEAALDHARAVVFRGGDFDRWDLEVRGGMLGAVRLRAAIEEHGTGKQMLRFRLWPRFSSDGVKLWCVIMGVALGAALDHAWVASVIFGVIALTIALAALEESASATSVLLRVLRDMEKKPGKAPQESLAELLVAQKIAKITRPTFLPHKVVVAEPGSMEKGRVL